jgi:hypothetical protein
MEAGNQAVGTKAAVASLGAADKAVAVKAGEAVAGVVAEVAAREEQSPSVLHPSSKLVSGCRANQRA